MHGSPHLLMYKDMQPALISHRKIEEEIRIRTHSSFFFLLSSGSSSFSLLKLAVKKTRCYNAFSLGPNAIDTCMCVSQCQSKARAPHNDAWYARIETYFRCYQGTTIHIQDTIRNTMYWRIFSTSQGEMILLLITWLCLQTLSPSLKSEF